MKSLRKPNLSTFLSSLILFTFFGIIFSCTKEDFEPIHQVSMSHIEKQQILQSPEFTELQRLSSVFLGSITQKLLYNPELVAEIIEFNYSDSEIVEKFVTEYELLKKNQKIFGLTQSMVYAYPVLIHLYQSEQSLLINELMQAQEKNLFRVNTFDLKSFFRNNDSDSCKQQFEKDIQYIHGQYDAAILGATIGIVSGGATSNPISVSIGAGISVWAVARAIYKIAVAIDEYNECIKN